MDSKLCNSARVSRILKTYRVQEPGQLKYVLVVVNLFEWFSNLTIGKANPVHISYELFAVGKMVF